MPLIPLTNQEAQIYNLHANDRHPVFTLYLWAKCHFCPPFREKMEEALKELPNTDVHLVMYDEDPSGVSKHVEGFPTLTRKDSKGITSFEQARTVENLKKFLTTQQGG